MSSTSSFGSHIPDPTGFAVAIPSIVSACGAAFAGCTSAKDLAVGFNFADQWNLTTFRWQGVHWTAGILAGRLSLVLLGAVATGLGVLFFDRFEATREKRVQRRAPAIEVPETASSQWATMFD